MAITILITMPLYYFFLKYNFNSLSERGQFGDSFGFMNTIFTGLAFSGVIVTILMQRHELIKQREDLERGRLEDRKQRFEKSIFMLINLHLDIVDKLELLSKRKRDVFDVYNEIIRSSAKELEAFYTLRKLTSTQLSIFTQIINEQELEDKLFVDAGLEQSDKDILKEILIDKKILDLFMSNDQDEHINILKKAIKKSRIRHNDILAHYFRNLYNIFKSIDQADFLDETEKIKLSKLVRTQLSNSEMIAICYNAIVEIEEVATGLKPLGYPKMTRLIKKYDVLKHLGEYSLYHSIHRTIFDKACEKAIKETV